MSWDRAEARRRLCIGSLLGVTWYTVLLIPTWTRQALTASDRQWWSMLTLMIAASAVASLLVPVARLSKKMWRAALMGLALPVLGALVYSEMVLFVDLCFILPASTLSENPGGPLDALAGAVGFVIYSAALGAPVVAHVAYEQAFFVALPMGFVHVFVLGRFTHDGSRPSPKLSLPRDRSSS